MFVPIFEHFCSSKALRNPIVAGKTSLAMSGANINESVFDNKEKAI